MFHKQNPNHADVHTGKYRSLSVWQVTDTRQTVFLTKLENGIEIWSEWKVLVKGLEVLMNWTKNKSRKNFFLHHSEVFSLSSYFQYSIL